MKSYGQDCPVARALDVVGERWSLLILRHLLVNDPQRFQDLQRALPGVPPNTLSARLKSLEAHGVVVSELYSQHPPRLAYTLTQKGCHLGPALVALREWGRRFG